MDAIPALSISGTRTADRLRRATALAATMLLCGTSQAAQEQQGAAQEQAAVQQPVAAVLKLREVDFVYRGSAARLSCGALQGRVASILVALGARQDLGVRVTDCETVADPMSESMDESWRMPSDRWQDPSDDWQDPSDRWRDPSDRWGRRSDEWRGPSGRIRSPGSRREQSARVVVQAMMPVEATPEVMAELERDKSRRDLISRVTGNPAAGFNDPVVFPAARQLVTLSHETIELQPEDCELLEQMSRSVFRKLDVRVVRPDASCSRNQSSRIPPKLTVEALMPVMPNIREPQVMPAPEQGDSAPGAPAAGDPGPPNRP